MPVATDAKLAYGYDLGGPDEWRLRNTDQDGMLPPLVWYDGEQDADFIMAAERQLLAAVAGFTETWTKESRNNGYVERLNDAKKRLGVVIEEHCSDSSPAYLLAAHVTTVHRGQVEHIDPRDLAERPMLMNWDDKLARAVHALGLVPVQPEPRWLLVSYAEL